MRQNGFLHRTASTVTARQASVVSPTFRTLYHDATRIPPSDSSVSDAPASITNRLPSSCLGLCSPSPVRFGPPHGMWYEWWPFDPKPYPQTTNAFIGRLDTDKLYFWCTCGRSKNQPFCDGSHKGTMYRPLVFGPGISKMMLYCGCKHAFLDGPHCRGSCLWVKADRNLPLTIINCYFVGFGFGMWMNYLLHP